MSTVSYGYMYNRHFERLFDKTARFIRGRGNYNCNIETVNQIRDIYRPDGYYLMYKLPDFNEQDFTNKIKHRAVYVNAQQETG